MLKQEVRDLVRYHRGKGLTCREVAALLGTASKSSVQRFYPGKPKRGKRCPTCGAKVILPCRACAVRATIATPPKPGYLL
jgi:hypothetical protein